jgi:hypothetical protein
VTSLAREIGALSVVVQGLEKVLVLQDAAAAAVTAGLRLVVPVLVLLLLRLGSLLLLLLLLVLALALLLDCHLRRGGGGRVGGGRRRYDQEICATHKTRGGRGVRVPRARCQAASVLRWTKVSTWRPTHIDPRTPLTYPQEPLLKRSWIRWALLGHLCTRVRRVRPTIAQWTANKRRGGEGLRGTSHCREKRTRWHTHSTRSPPGGAASLSFRVARRKGFLPPPPRRSSPRTPTTDRDIDTRKPASLLLRAHKRAATEDGLLA